MVKIIFFIFSSVISYIIIDSIFSENKDKYIVILTAFMVLILVFQLIVMANQTRIFGLQVGISENQAEILERTSTSYFPDIEAKYIENRNWFDTIYLKNKDGGNDLTFVYRNKGEESSRQVIFYFWDKNREFTKPDKEYIKVVSVEPLSSGDMTFDIVHPFCEEPGTSISSCKEFEVKPGLFEWYLKIECPYCERTYKCYSLALCFVNKDFSPAECESSKDYYSDLKELKECPIEKEV